MAKKKSKKVAKKAVKKSVKKVSKRVAPKQNSMALATISYNDIAKPEMFENKNKQGQALHLMKSSFPGKVIDFINMPTPAKYVLQREGTGGKKFPYIPGWYAKKCANYAFGFNHSFEIKSREIVGLSAIVEGRFIVTDPKTGREILHKDDVGGHKIQFLSGKPHTPEWAVDLANDYKSAATDAMKRCMSQLGFWKDVYGVSEAKSDGVRVKDQPETVVVDSKDAVSGPDGEQVFTCRVCDEIVDAKVAGFSKKIYGKVLCREHQPKKR